MCSNNDAYMKGVTHESHCRWTHPHHGFSPRRVVWTTSCNAFNEEMPCWWCHLRFNQWRLDRQFSPPDTRDTAIKDHHLANVPLWCHHLPIHNPIAAQMHGPHVEIATQLEPYPHNTCYQAVPRHACYHHWSHMGPRAKSYNYIHWNCTLQYCICFMVSYMKTITKPLLGPMRER